jgi:hypothetical protein
MTNCILVDPVLHLQRLKYFVYTDIITVSVSFYTNKHHSKYFIVVPCILITFRILFANKCALY